MDLHGVKDGLTERKELDMSEKSKKGIIMEHKAAVKFMRKDYFVFMSTDPQSPFDLVAVHPNGEIKLVDVKSESYRKKDKTKINRVLTKNQRQFVKSSGLKIHLEMLK